MCISMESQEGQNIHMNKRVIIVFFVNGKENRKDNDKKPLLLTGDLHPCHSKPLPRFSAVSSDFIEVARNGCLKYSVKC